MSMTFSSRFRGKVLNLGLLAMVSLSPSALACATCFGESDSPLAAGVSWGILTMIVVAYSVLFSIIGFFIFVARRAAAMAALETEVGELQESAVAVNHNNELCSKNS